MSIKELHTNDFATINGGTKEDYNIGKALGARIRENILKVIRLSIW